MTQTLKKKTTLKIIVANNLNDGSVVYFTGTKWAQNLQLAMVSADEEDLLSAAQNTIKFENIIGLELVTVEIQKKTIIPTSVREKIRALGPTVDYLLLGKLTGRYNNVSV